MPQRPVQNFAMFKPRHRFARIALIGFAAALYSAAAFPLVAFQQVAGETAPSITGLGFDENTGQLTGRVDAGASISTIIEQIGQIAGFSVQLQPGLGSLSHALELDGLTVEAALNRLIRSRSFVLYRGSDDVGPDGIRKIWIIVEGAPFEPELAPVALAEPSLEVPEGERGDLEVTRAIAIRDIIKLSNSSDNASVKKLRELAQSADDPAIRRSALSALTGRVGAETYNLFVYSGLRDPDATVRIQAARSVLRVDQYRGAAVVEAAASRETDPVTREIMQRLARGETVERATNLLHGRLSQ